VTTSLTIVSGSTFAGNYTGSFFQNGNGGGIGTVAISVSSGGAVSGSSTDYSGSTPSTVTLSGTVSTTGSATITSQSNQGSNTVSGVFKFGPAGNLIGVLHGGSSDSLFYVTVVLTSTGKPAQYVGNYTGSSTDPMNGVSPITSFNISSSGSWTATGSGGSTASGTVNASGVSTFTSHGSDGTKTGTIYFAFDITGLLYGLVVNGSGTSILSLTKSYAGIYQLTSNSGNTATIAVNDAGVALGSSGPGEGAFTLSGTVSAAGAVNLTGTPIDSNQGGSVTITGSISAVEEGFNGSGTYNGSAGNSGTWTVTGEPSIGIFYAGTYNLTTSSAQSLTLAIGTSGTITVTGSAATGATFVGCIDANGAVVIVAVSPASGSPTAATVFTGAFVAAGNGYTGSGGYLSASGSTGTWTATSN